MPQPPPSSPSSRRAFSTRQIPCPHATCNRWFKTLPGLKRHQSSLHNFTFSSDSTNVTAHHRPPSQPAPGTTRDYHETLTVSDKSADDWGPYGDKLRFETAEFIFQNAEMSGGEVDRLCELWGRSLQSDSGGALPPFTDHKELYKTIDATQVGDVQWDSFSLKYDGERPSIGDVPPWMDIPYDFWFRPAYRLVERLLSNTDFDGEFDYVPHRDFAGENEARCYENFMSGDWAWTQADRIAADPSTHGSTFVPIILGSDKTTVSVATGQNDYWPVYLSIGNIHNNVWRAHRNAVEPLAFLAIPKAAKKYTDNPLFRRFKKQLFHAAMTRILTSLNAGMTTPQLMKCPDRHFRRIVFGIGVKGPDMAVTIGPYIADYPEQVLISGIVQNWCGRCLAFPNDLDSGGAPRTKEFTHALIEELPLGVIWDEWGVDANIVPFTHDFARADIRQLLAPDILHQLIKGTFKDHLVEWVGKYLELEYGKAGAKERLADIDRHIASAPPFPGLRRFPDGRGFSQWTGNDSKALMKVYLPAIEGHVPDDMVCTFRAFLEFCYIVRRNVITDDTLDELKDALQRFHQYREVFRDLGVRPDGFSLPRQHSLTHYEALIRLFGAPNGLCTSITESKHITAVKKPWRRSSKYNALDAPQFPGPVPAARNTAGNFEAVEEENEEGGNLEEDESAGIVDERPGLAHSNVVLACRPARNRAKTSHALAIELGIPSLPSLITHFLSEQLHPESQPTRSGLLPFTGPIKIFNSAIATFVAPSDPSGIGSMRHEHIHAVPSWRRGLARYDCVFVSTDDTQEGMLGMEVARVYCFFSFIHTDGETFPCALVHWFDRIADVPDELTGMWMVAPSFLDDGSHNLAVVHVDSITRCAHLLPIFGKENVPSVVHCHNSLDVYRAFYVNRFADHHTYELTS
ncbi:hypothetical protein BU15DRAFT_88408 [Melanogaster broomeanus]|nr:hypothetical protein BU15DRAFT_88408 [Melanogaster broomeanus]